MKITHTIGLAIMVSSVLCQIGCSTMRNKSLDTEKITFLTDDCGEFIFQRSAVVDFLETQKEKEPKALELLTVIVNQKNISSVKLSCNEYCPALFNEMLAKENDFTVSCKKCCKSLIIDKIQGKFKDASYKEIQYIDNNDHVLINIRLEK